MAMSKYFNKLIILEMANNHCGNVNTGLEIIKQAKEVCEPYKQYGFQFAVKLQYRTLDTFIHPDYKDSDLKYVKRFRETRLTEAEYLQLKNAIVEAGFISACTPFDEASVDLIEKYGFDIIKIGSCSFTDWPLLEWIALTNKPIIASTGAASLEDIDRVVSFFEHRKKDFALMHCVPEYPARFENWQIGQIEFLQNRFRGIPVGWSDHSEFGSVSARASIYERHICLDKGNSYSSPINKFKETLDLIAQAQIARGVLNQRHEIPVEQKESLRGLQRGVFASRDIQPNEIITTGNSYFAMPAQKEQLMANHISKYIRHEYVINETLKKDSPILCMYLSAYDFRSRVLEIVQKLIPVIKESGVALPDRCELELSSHYGLDRFEEYGEAIFTIINREYAKKILVMLPKQKHPEHYHKDKTETFNILFGRLTLNCEELSKGDLETIEPGEAHTFYSHAEGCVFEEISTTHYPSDSFYESPNVLKDRKTKLTFYKEWLDKGVK
jgi:sialic acid synthase SpsE/mannose-6-phosphate isomerase-like protein (cupin superfamily)